MFGVFMGAVLMALAVFFGLAWGAYRLWQRGGLKWLTFLPPPPTQETKQ